MADRSLAVLPKELAGVRAAGSYDFDQLFRFAQICHASGLFEDTSDAAQAFAKIAKGQELGLPPMASMSGIDIIRKRLFMKPWVVAAKINACGYGSYRVTEQTPERCAIVFRRKYAGEGWVALPAVTYTYAEAKAHGLVERSPHWKASPAHMLYQRCMGRGGAMHFPELLAGLDVPQDDEPISPARHEQNIIDLFGEGDGAEATAAPVRTGKPFLPPSVPVAGEEGASYLAQIEAAILAQHGDIEAWMVWAERKYRKTRGAFSVADWDDCLQAVRATASKLVSKAEGSSFSPAVQGLADTVSAFDLEHEEVQTTTTPVSHEGGKKAALAGDKARSGQTAPSTPATAALVLGAQGGQKAGSGDEEPFVDPETGEILTPGYGMGASWGPENPNLVVEDETTETRHD